MRHTVKHALLAVAFLAAAVPHAFAHKAKDNHTHCTVDGKGIAAEGKTDAERKAACTAAKGSWDEKKEVPVEAAKAVNAKAEEAKPEEAKPEEAKKEVPTK